MNPGFWAWTIGHLKEEEEVSGQKEDREEGGSLKKRLKGIYIKKIYYILSAQTNENMLNTQTGKPAKFKSSSRCFLLWWVRG